MSGAPGGPHDLVLNTQNIPEITQTILNLAEFMEHCEEATVSGERGEGGKATVSECVAMC